jgi:hypothetical protein
MTDTKKKTADKAAPAKVELSFAFGKMNYTLMLVGVAIIAIGFYLMSGTEDIFNSTKLTVAPVVIIIGFIVELFAVMLKSKD